LKKPIVLVDSDEDGKNAKTQIEEKFPNTIVISYEDMESITQKNVEIEDLIHTEDYLKAINIIHENDLNKKLTSDELAKINGSRKEIKKIKLKHIKKIFRRQ